MKSIDKFLLILLAIFALSCESIQEESIPEVEAEVEVAKDPEISFSASINTRATETDFESGDKISVTAYEADGSIYATNVSYSYSGSIFSSTSPIEYSDADQQLAFRAIYPYVEMDSDKNVTFAVKADQNSGSNYTLSDLMLSYVGYTSDTEPQLAFDHLLSKVVVNITSTDVEMINVTASVNASTSVEYNLGTLSSTTSSSIETVTMASNGVNSYKVILAPQKISSGELFGSIDVNGAIYDFGFSATVDMLAGKEYTINATIFDGEITFDTPIINGWDEGVLPDAPDGYIAIYTAEQLASIGVDESYPLDGSYFLVNDLDLSSYSNWTPIGINEGVPFVGVFEGNNKTISNLTINADADYSGLFGFVLSATISNITLKTPQVKGLAYVGALCGYCYSSEEAPTTLENCGVEGGSVSGTSENGEAQVGGVCGYAFSYSIITSCYNTSDVSGTSVKSNSYVGGVCGYSKSAITFCYNTGDVSGVSEGASAYAGGVCGSITSATITFCYNIGDVSGTSENMALVGGVCGSSVSYSAITSCYNMGDVYADAQSSYSYAGGVCGYPYIYSTITSCYNMGDISGTSKGSNSYAGGVSGYLYNSSSVTSCYNTGDVSGNADSYPAYTGGVSGRIYTSTLTSCYNTGDVSVASGSSSVYIGGVCGSTASSTITSCYYLPYAGVTYTNYEDGTADENVVSTMTSSSFVSTLNTAAGETHWAYDLTNINDGYPILVSIDYN